MLFYFEIFSSLVFTKNSGFAGVASVGYLSCSSGLMRHLEPAKNVKKRRSVTNGHKD